MPKQKTPFARDAYLEIPFRPSFDQNELISTDPGGKRKKMFFFHRMGTGDIPFVLHRTQDELMGFIGFLRGECFQRSAAAG